MKKKNIRKEHTLTRDGLHDLMIETGYREIKKYIGVGIGVKINKKEISNLVYEYIDYVANKNKVEKEIISYSSALLELDLPEKFYEEIYYEEFFKYINFFEYKKNSYIFWMFDNDKSNKSNSINTIEFIECLLDNYKNLDNYSEFLKYLLKENKNLLIQYSIEEEFKKYDYVKILTDSSNICLEDVKKCTNYLYSSIISRKLTIEEKICLKLIIIYGLKNIYFNYSDYYKKQHINFYDNAIPNISDWLKEIENDNDTIFKRKIYSKDYDCYIDLNEKINVFKKKPDLQFKIFKNYNSDNCLFETVKLIYFENLINNNLYHEARKYLDDNIIYLFLNFERYFKISDDKEDAYSVKKVNEMIIKDIEVDYSLLKVDLNSRIYNINDLLSDNQYKIIYIIPTLKFLISYFRLLKSEGKELQANCLYEFLKIFNRGFGIEEFLTKYDYERLLSELSKLKVDNEDNIDNAINNIADKINRANLVSKYDINRINKIYPYINFNNLDEKTQKYVATGDTILLFFNNSNSINFDYSSAVIEWCKAVELETYNKLTKKIKIHEVEINKQIIKKQIKDKNFEFRDTIGTFSAIDKRVMKDGRTMSMFLFDEYYSRIYDFDKNLYDVLMKNIISIHKTRNDSAHKYKTIDYKTARECQSIILSAKKILEILSKLKEK